MIVTTFENFCKPLFDEKLIDIANLIASDSFKTQVEEIRALTYAGLKEEASEKKKQLLAFTPSGTFTKRKAAHLEEYSGFVHLDFDKLSHREMYSAFKAICDEPYTYLCFQSPSGNGLKVFVQVDSGAEKHSEAYLQVQQHYEALTGIKSDPACKDITRLCFVSYDPSLFLNKKSIKFEVITSIVKHNQQVVQGATKRIFNSNTDSEYTAALIECVRYTEKKEVYSAGNRNNFIFLFSTYCNRMGVPEKTAMHYAKANYDLPGKEVEMTFRNTYKTYASEFAKIAKSAKSANAQEITKQSIELPAPEEDYLKNTPLIPELVYSNLPDLLLDGTLVFTDLRERDVFLTGALVILSGCLPGVKGIYAGQEVYPNLFGFIVAPAASGKGALNFAKMLADVYHNSLLTNSRDAESNYNQEISAHKQKMQQKKKGDISVEEEPVKPPFKVLMIPANSSNAKIISHLEQNDGSGIICETEADTLGNIFKQEWGSYSDMLRKAFHHERITCSRKANNEFIEVDRPCMSVALSGTPNQVTGIISSSEDGLFSRFMFYVFKTDQIWKDVSPEAHNVNLTEHFKSLSIQVFEMVEYLRMKETTITLSPEQWNLLNTQCKEWLNDVTLFTGEDAASIVKRLGLITYRIAMILTAIAKIEIAEEMDHMDCMDTEFYCAMELAKVYLKHSILMFNNLPKNTKVDSQFKAGGSIRKVFDALPNEFTRMQAVEAGNLHQLSARTVDEFLRNGVDKILVKIKAGSYKKVG